MHPRFVKRLDFRHMILLLLYGNHIVAKETFSLKIFCYSVIVTGASTSSSSSSAQGEANPVDKKKRGKKRAKEQGKEIKYTEIEGYVGDKEDLDDLLKYIENTNDSNEGKGLSLLLPTQASIQ